MRPALLALTLLLLTRATFGAPLLDRPFLRYDRVQLFGLQQQARLDRALAAGRMTADTSVAGAFDFDVQVPADGWFELLVEGGGGNVDYLVDPPVDGEAEPVAYGVNATRQNQAKVGNLWLPAGRHTLRLQRRVWNGFSLSRVRLQPADVQSLGKTLRIEPDHRRFQRLGACEPLRVTSAGRGSASVLTVLVQPPAGPVQPLALTIPAGTSPLTQVLALPCAQPGRHRITYVEAGRAIDPFDLRTLDYDVVDVERPLPTLLDAPATLVEEIDPLARVPDFGSGSTVVQRGGLSYRESGDRGWIPWQRQSAAQQAALPAPSWFAYRLQPLAPQQAYRIEVDLPDDAERAQAVVLRERLVLPYPVSIGADTGAVHGLSRRMQTLTLPFWPRTSNPRLVVMNALDGQRAAIGRIRVYRIETAAAPPRPPAAALRTRQYVSWYEEGLNFSGVYGAVDKGTDASIAAIDRWAQLVRDVGGSTLKPAVSIYSFSLYPARRDPVFAAPPGEDLLRRLLLAAEQNGLKLIAELHPRADQLSYPHESAPQPQPQLAVKKDGSTQPDFHNLLFGPNADWLVNLVGEIADRYRDSPAFDGIDLRLMPWANRALNNVVSVDWGYDDLSVRRFNSERQTGMPAALLQPLKGRDPLAAQRHDWLMAHAREAWIAWRCEQVARLYTRLRDRVRQARPDLRLYSTVFAWSDTASVAALREAGIDPARLRAIDGLVLVNAQYSYGRREPDAALNQREHQRLADPASLQLLAPASGHFMAGAGYFEATDAVAPPGQLGYDAGGPAGWSSTAASPVGRRALARLAIPLARADAQMLGDGGNMFTFGEPGPLREFLTEYRLLPEVPFTPRSAAGDAVAVWSHAPGLEAGDGEWLYLVNATDQPQRRSLAFSGDGPLRRLRGGEPVPLQGQAIELILQPYELIGLRSNGSLRLR